MKSTTPYSPPAGRNGREVDANSSTLGHLFGLPGYHDEQFH